MKDTCKHEIYKAETGGIMITNDLDEYYCQILESPKEVNDFIDRVINAAKEAFGPTYEYKKKTLRS